MYLREDNKGESGDFMNSEKLQNLILDAIEVKHKKKMRKWARKSLKQDKFYNGFYEFIEENRKKNGK